MTPEEKAKRYDEAFERVKELLSRCRDNRDRRNMVYRVNDIESIFPELKKSEDEKIKEDLIEWISDFPDMIWSGHYKKDVIAWLEKQGEQKQDVNVQINPSEYINNIGGNGCYLKNATQTSTCSKKEEKVDNQNCVKSVDDIKPKFKVGDWISNDMCDVHIASIEDGMYYFDEGDGLSIVFVDEHYHLWTIEDAMDGDVLFQDFMCGKTFIYNGVNTDKAILYSFIISNDGEDVLPYHIGKPNTGIGYIEENKNIIHPATKEQRDFLFQKMKEEGYVWDSEKKELIIDWNKHIKYEPNVPSIIEENTKWSDEDEYMLDETIQHLKQLIEIDKAKHCGCDVQYYQRDIDWLKSLRPHKQWKPSEEQMDALETAVSSIQSNTLETLYQDLKREKNYE